MKNICICKTIIKHTWTIDKVNTEIWLAIRRDLFLIDLGCFIL